MDSGTEIVTLCKGTECELVSRCAIVLDLYELNGAANIFCFFKFISELYTEMLLKILLEFLCVFLLYHCFSATGLTGVLNIPVIII